MSNDLQTTSKLLIELCLNHVEERKEIIKSTFRAFIEIIQARLGADTPEWTMSDKDYAKVRQVIAVFGAPEDYLTQCDDVRNKMHERLEARKNKSIDVDEWVFPLEEEQSSKTKATGRTVAKKIKVEPGTSSKFAGGDEMDVDNSKDEGSNVEKTVHADVKCNYCALKGKDCLLSPVEAEGLRTANFEILLDLYKGTKRKLKCTLCRSAKQACSHFDRIPNLGGDTSKTSKRKNETTPTNTRNTRTRTTADTSSRSAPKPMPPPEIPHSAIYHNKTGLPLVPKPIQHGSSFLQPQIAPSTAPSTSATSDAALSVAEDTSSSPDLDGILTIDEQAANTKALVEARELLREAMHTADMYSARYSGIERTMAEFHNLFTKVGQNFAEMDAERKMVASKLDKASKILQGIIFPSDDA